jgi:WD40 repeat protein
MGKKPHFQFVNQICPSNYFSMLPDGNIITEFKGLLTVFNLVDKIHKSSSTVSYARSLLILDDGNILVCFSDRIEIWDKNIIDSPKLIKTIGLYEFTFYSNPLILLTGDLFCFACDEEYSSMLVFSQNKYFEEHKIIAKDHSSTCNVVNLSNNKFAFGGINFIYIWDIDNGYTICAKLWVGVYIKVISLLYINKDNLLASSSGVEIKIWDLNSYECIKEIYGHVDIVHCLLLLPGGYLASGSEDKTIKIWDMKNYECVNVLEGHNGKVEFILLLKDFRIASASNDIIIWDF